MQEDFSNEATVVAYDWAPVLTDEGMLADPETGEILDTKQFAPDVIATADDAESVLDRMRVHTARVVAATNARKAAINDIDDLVYKALEKLAEDPAHVEATSRLAQAEAVLDRASKAVLWLQNRYITPLGAFARPLLKGTSRSLDLLGGRISLRRMPAGVAVTDPEAFVSWAQAHGRMDLVKFEPAKSAINKAWVEIAHIKPDGLEPVPESETVTVKFPGLEDAR